MQDVLNLIAGFAYSTIFLCVFYLAWRRNLFWVNFLGVEYFYVLGLGVYPILNSLGFVGSPDFLSSGNVSIMTPVHIIFYALGALFGFSWVNVRTSRWLTNFAIGLKLNPQKTFSAILGVALVFFVLYILSVGFQEAVLGASFARSGDFDYFESGSAYAFLKRPMMIGLLCVAYAHFFIFAKNRPFYYLIVSSLVGASIYLVTVSRYALFQCILLPLAFYVVFLMKKGVFSKLVGLVVILLGGGFGLAVLTYGKFALYQIASYFFVGGVIDLDVAGNQGGDWGAFSHLYYSIDAGVRNFIENGPVVYKDVLISPFGIIPSSVLGELGLDSISYQFSTPGETFSCVNTALLSNDSGCFVPPYFTGASAYIFPVFGGFLFGFVRFHIYALVSRSWSALEASRNESHIPIILVIFYFLEQVMLFIPATISMVIFSLLLSIFFIKTKLIK